MYIYICINTTLLIQITTYIYEENTILKKKKKIYINIYICYPCEALDDPISIGVYSTQQY